MPTSYLLIGSNINPEDNIRECIRLLKKELPVGKISSVYETEPVGFKAQPNFYNLAVEIETNLSPENLLWQLQSIEKSLGRVRNKKTKKDHPRTIDIDILLYGDKIILTENLVIPHPRMHQRGFVLVPLTEIASDVLHPAIKKTVSELLKSIDKTEIIKKIQIKL